MGTRHDLQQILEAVMGSRNVYFQPPENVKLKYPCIVYSRSAGNSRYADNNPYKIFNRYELVLIDKDPDTKYFEPISYLKSCTFERHYVSEGLYHDVFYVYY